MSETRVIGAQNRKIGGGQRPSVAAPEPAPAPAPAAPKRRSRLLVLALVVLVAAAGAVFYLTRPAASEAAPEEPAPGLTMLVDPRNINLADGRYLRLGFAIELVEDAEEVPLAPATDIAIALFSGRDVAEVNDVEQRAALKEQLTHQLSEVYEGQVYAVYFTDFVTQ